MSIVEQFIILSNEAKTQEEVFEHFQNALKSFGFDSIVYSLLTDHASLDRRAGHGVISKYPADWMEYYGRKGYLKDDAVIKHAFTTTEAYSWDGLIQSGAVSDRGKRIIEESKDAKLYNGAAVAIYGPNMEIAGVGLASTSGGVSTDKNTLSIIRALSNQFHAAYSVLDPNYRRPEFNQYRLTKRQAEILSWVAEGKSINSIASILSISSHVVKYHLGEVYRRLEVTDQIQAVVKAVMFGLIKPMHVKGLSKIKKPK
jgi:DNA-binding CsgD family transcriptional regulator